MMLITMGRSLVLVAFAIYPLALHARSMGKYGIDPEINNVNARRKLVSTKSIKTQKQEAESKSAKSMQKLKANQSSKSSLSKSSKSKSSKTISHAASTSHPSISAAPSVSTISSFSAPPSHSSAPSMTAVPTHSTQPTSTGEKDVIIENDVLPETESETTVLGSILTSSTEQLTGPTITTAEELPITEPTEEHTTFPEMTTSSTTTTMASEDSSPEANPVVSNELPDDEDGQESSPNAEGDSPLQGTGARPGTSGNGNATLTAPTVVISGTLLIVMGVLWNRQRSRRPSSTASSIGGEMSEVLHS